MWFSYLRYLGLCAGQLAVANNLGEHVRLTQDQNFVGPELDLGPAVLAEDDLVAFLEIHLDVLPVLVPRTGADGEDLAALRLLLRRVWQHDAADRGLLLIEDLDDQAVTKRLQVHPHSSCSDDFVTTIGTLPSGVPGQCIGLPPARASRSNHCVTKSRCAGSSLRAAWSFASCGAARSWRQSGPRGSRTAPGPCRRG